MVATYEHSVHPGAMYRSSKGALALEGQVKLTIDQDEISPGSAQRGRSNGEVHRDDHSLDVPTWLHMYVASDSSPTEFFAVDQPGIAGQGYDLDPQKLGKPVTAGEYEVAFANSTSLHRSPVVTQGGQRTFLRLQYLHAV